MKEYKGYHIDGVYFNNKEDIDAFLKKQAIKAYRIACEMFAIHPDMEHSLYASERADILNNQFGHLIDSLQSVPFVCGQISIAADCENFVV